MDGMDGRDGWRGRMDGGDGGRGRGERRMGRNRNHAFWSQRSKGPGENGLQSHELTHMIFMGRVSVVRGGESNVLVAQGDTGGGTRKE